ncbi:MAG: tetratricopeptide repeat protein [SAR324 cluster bacterium]|nr:tetratricopeptide repeat protein [SAR324 cluster bacterium]
MFPVMTPDRFPKGLRNVGAAVLAVLILSAAAGCAKTSDLKKEQEANRIQEVRIGALERDTQTFISRHESRLDILERQLKNLQGIQLKQLENKLRILQEKQLEKFESQLQNLRGGQLKKVETQLKNLQGAQLKNIDTRLKILRGGLLLVKRSNKEIIKEQTAIREAQERTLFGQRKMERMITGELAKFARFRLEAENDLDKMRTRMGQMENLMRSSIARLPAKTRADKAFRQSHALIVNGELDLAADSFEAFGKKYPKDKRRAEALFRRGQALFLLGKYDHALIPFFGVVEKFPKHKLAPPARWMLARSLEETGDLRLARDFYAQLITGKTPYANDATRRVAFINKLYPGSAKSAVEKPGRRGKKK